MQQVTALPFLYLNSSLLHCLSDAVSCRIRSHSWKRSSSSPLTKENDMKPALIKLPMVMGIVLLGTLLTGTAFAGCGDAARAHGTLVPQSWNGQDRKSV